jgi:hypothetical protein
MGVDDPVEVPDGIEVSGSANMNFRTGSAPCWVSSNFLSTSSTGRTPGERRGSGGESEVEITVELFVDAKHYWQGQIHIQSATLRALPKHTTFASPGSSWQTDLHPPARRPRRSLRRYREVPFERKRPTPGVGGKSRLPEEERCPRDDPGLRCSKDPPAGTQVRRNTGAD